MPKEHDKFTKELHLVVRNLFKADNTKYKTSVRIWQDSDDCTNIDAHSLDLTLLTENHVSATPIRKAMSLCGVADQDTDGLEASAVNEFKLLAERLEGDDAMYEDERQNCMQSEWKGGKGPGTLRAACDGRFVRVLPMFISDGDTLKQTAKPDIMSMACPMVMEFKVAQRDPSLVDGLQQVLKRLHMLMRMNCFIARAFGFAVNGTDSSFLATIERRLVLGETHWYEDTVHILKIDTKYVAGLWNLLTAKAQQDPRFALHPDVFPLAATLRAMSSSQGPAPPATAPKWDLSRLIGFTKISLLGLSSSRVYGVYSAKMEAFTGVGKGIRTSLNEPEFLIKINDDDKRSLREHAVLDRLQRSFSKDLTTLFYVHQSFLFRPGQRFEAVDFSPVQVAGRFPTMAQLRTLQITGGKKFKGVCLDATCNTVNACWWNPLEGQPAFAASSFATVVMKRLYTFGRIAANAGPVVNRPIDEWLNHIHAARVLHTDIRSSNLMWLPLTGAAVALAQTNGLRCSSKAVFGSAALPDQSQQSQSCRRSLASQLDQLSLGPRGASQGTVVTAAAAATEETVALVDEEQWLLPLVVDFDCAELLSGDASSCEVNISIAGARTSLVRRITGAGDDDLVVRWNSSSDTRMAAMSCTRLEIDP